MVGSRSPHQSAPSVGSLCHRRRGTGFPDIAGIGIRGFRLDLKQAQDEIARLRQEVNAQARSSAKATIGPIYIDSGERAGLETFGRVALAEQDEQETYVPRHLDAGSTAEVP